MTGLRISTRKWPDSPHWEVPAEALGADAHGHWFGVRRGVLMQRPGMRVTAPGDHVVLAPYDDWWMATFYGVRDENRPCDIYIDVTTVPEIVDLGVRAVDLDLDVIRTVERQVYVDDEDEFAEHRVALGYPSDVVLRAEESAAWLQDRVTAGEAPFDEETSAGWLARLRRRIEPGG